MTSHPFESARRSFLKSLVAIPVAHVIGTRLGWLDDVALACGAGSIEPITPKNSTARRLTPTPDCDDGDEPTPSETEGPFYTPETPKRTSLIEPGMKGTRIELRGRVFGRNCRPISGAMLDFWHADDDGEYDNAGFKLRGHQFTDAGGHWRLETIVPGVYPGRTRHVHVKVRAPKGRALTTQLYFPGESRNRNDGLYRPDLLVAVTDGAKAKTGRFDFVLDVA